ncbi:MAG: tetratricopeptide repeat protein [Nitrospinaceae bacterium]
MTMTRAFALFIAVVGTFLYIKTVYFSQENWEDYHNAGLAAYGKGDYAEAEKKLLAALHEAEKFPIDDPRLALSLNNMAEIDRVQGKYAEAEPYIKRSLAIAEKVQGSEHPKVAAILNTLAGNYRVRGMYAEAAPLAKRAFIIWEKTLGLENPLVNFALEGYVDLLHKIGRDAEAKSFVAHLKARQPNPAQGDSGN